MTALARVRAAPAAGLTVVCLLMVAGGVRPAAAETTEQYRQRLSRWSRVLDRARRGAEEGDPSWRAGLESIAREAGQPRPVARAEGAALSVEHGWLSSRLSEALKASGEAERSRALGLASKELSAYQAALSPAPPLDRARLEAVLRRSVPPAPPTRRLPLEWIGSLLRRLGAWLDGLLSRVPSRWGTTGSVLFWVVLGLAAAVLALGVGLAAKALLARFGPAKSRRPPVETAPVWRPPDPEAAAERAREAAAAGRYREAVRHLYLALLIRLDLAGLISYHPSRTNWEYLRALGGTASARLLQPLALFNSIFDRKWYGEESAGRADYEQCERLYSQLLAEAGAP